MLDHIDPGKVFKHRLFREHCTFYQGNYIKDLGRLGRSLASTIIIDNSPISYQWHVENAIPCESWFDDVNDTEMLDLIPFLMDLAKVEDVRTVLGR